MLDDLYGKLINEEDARVCREIPESACREVPRNFFLLIASNSVNGVVLLALGGMGTVAQVLSVPLVILSLSILGLAGAAMSRTLPEVT